MTASRAPSVAFRWPSERRPGRPSSSVVSRWIPYSAGASASSEKSTPASSSGTPSIAIVRRPSGYSGKNAVRGAVYAPRSGR